jgi:hypothetical protein
MGVGIDAFLLDTHVGSVDAKDVPGAVTEHIQLTQGLLESEKYNVRG